MQLTVDQQKAKDAFFDFVLDPKEEVFVLSGYSGCGKSTLVKQILSEYTKFVEAVKLVAPDTRIYDLALTATTNKAAENLQRITGQPVSTIQSRLGLRVNTNHMTGESTLVPVPTGRLLALPVQEIIFIDEASYVDKNLLQMIFERTHQCKICFIGDPAQLTPVKSTDTPVFNAGFSGAALTEVVRQAEGNPIVELSTLFRNTVNTGEFFSFTPDGFHIQHMSREDFNKKLSSEFTRPDWEYLDSKILTWTNKAAIKYNHAIHDLISGKPEFKVGNYAICNSFVNNRGTTLRTDELVEITGIVPHKELDVQGKLFTLDHTKQFFMPDSLDDKKAAIKHFKDIENYGAVATINESWIDLRAAYAQTINKSQGSTYRSVFIDLDDICKCNSGNQIARMLYVAVSRATDHVYLVGDLV